MFQGVTKFEMHLILSLSLCIDRTVYFKKIFMLDLLVSQTSCACKHSKLLFCTCVAVRVLPCVHSKRQEYQECCHAFTGQFPLLRNPTSVYQKKNNLDIVGHKVYQSSIWEDDL